MVKQARTIDLAVAIGGDDWIVELTRVLDLSIDGSASTTNEVVLGAVGRGSKRPRGRPGVQSFGTLYDGDRDRRPSVSIAAMIATQTHMSP